MLAEAIKYPIAKTSELACSVLRFEVYRDEGTLLTIGEIASVIFMLGGGLMFLTFIAHNRVLSAHMVLFPLTTFLGGLATLCTTLFLKIHKEIGGINNFVNAQKPQPEYFETFEEFLESYENSVGRIETYADGDCGMHVFGEIEIVEGVPQYRWQDGNPRTKLLVALKNQIESRGINELFTFYFERAISDFLSTVCTIGFSDEITSRLARDETMLQEYFDHLDKGLYLSEHEVVLFAYLVAQKNIEFHIGESSVFAVDLGFDELVKIEHVPDENPDLWHWQRI